MLTLKEISEGLNSIADNAGDWSADDIRRHAQSLRVALDTHQAAINAAVYALHSPRNHGRIDPDSDRYERLRPFFLAANPPHGGADIADQCAMTLQGLLGEEPTSVV